MTELVPSLVIEFNETYPQKFFHDIIKKPAYHYMMQFLRILRTTSFQKYPGYEKYKSRYDNIIRMTKEITDATNCDINQSLRLVDIEDDLIELVKNTDNNIFYRPLFFPTVFINNNITFGDLTIKGILIQEAITDDGEYESLYGELHEKYGKDANDHLIFIATINPIAREAISHFFSLTTKTTGEYSPLINFVKNMIVNIIDMVEGMDRDLSVTIIETTKEQNLKKIQRGQIPFPTKVYIKAQGEFKKYVQRFNTDVQENEKGRKILYKFMVRGHWRHFRAERYKKETKAKSKWIKPFWKGEGIPIAKEYKLVH